MKITVSPDTKEWTDFEKEEWKKVDKEHFGHEVQWDKKHFKLSALEGKKTVGSLRLDVKGGIAYIDAIIVAFRYRNKGIGSQLMQKAESIAKENNAHKIFLQTGNQWEAVEFYKTLGYKPTSHLPNHYFHVNFVEMTKLI